MAILGIFSCHRLRHCYTEPLKGALGLLIKLSDVERSMLKVACVPPNDVINSL